VDLLSNLDPTRSARVRSCPGSNREISTNLVATPHQLGTLALATRARANRLRTVPRRNRRPHRLCVRLAIPTHRRRHGRAPCLCGESAATVPSSCNSWRRLHRQHRLQRLPDSETRHSRVRSVLHKLQHPADICARSCRRGTLCLRRGHSPFLCDRATFPPIASPTRSTKFTRRGGQTSGATKVAPFPLFPSAFCPLPSLMPPEVSLSAMRVELERR
jgi:hypothetical protein